MPDLEAGGAVEPPADASALTVVVAPRDAEVSADADAAALKKVFLAANESDQELCRVCQQESEEELLVLGCQCRGELSKAHKSCIDTWFRTIGSNKCEICQQVASNVPFSQSQPITNYWVWRVNPSPSARQRNHSCFTPAWVALSILIGGLLLDVLISVSLGVAALPVNIIVGIAIVLGLGTAIRLILECCQEWTLQRNHPEVDGADNSVNRGYAPSV